MRVFKRKSDVAVLGKKGRVLVIRSEGVKRGRQRLREKGVKRLELCVLRPRCARVLGGGA